MYDIQTCIFWWWLAFLTHCMYREAWHALSDNNIQWLRGEGSQPWRDSELISALTEALDPGITGCVCILQTQPPDPSGWETSLYLLRRPWSYSWGSEVRIALTSEGKRLAEQPQLLLVTWLEGKVKAQSPFWHPSSGGETMFNPQAWAILTIL